jgi:hypothetical protein
MNPLFIISDINDVFKDNSTLNYGIYDEEDKGDVIEQYRGFRSKIFSLNNYSEEIFNNEIILVCIRDLSAEFNIHSDAIDQLIKDKTFDNDVRSIFCIDIWNNLSSNLSADIINKINLSNSKFIEKSSAEVFYLILSKENKEAKEVTINDIHHQINKFLHLLNSNYFDIYNYFKSSNQSSFFINSFGSSAILFPKSNIEKSIFYLNNASQLYFLLNNKKFNKDEFYNISALIPSLIDNSKVEKLLKDKYSKTPDEVNTLDSVGTLYDECDIDNITNAFDNIELFAFSNFTSKNEGLSTSIIDATHNDYLLDINHRTTDAVKETEKFFNNAIILFRDYRNDKIISIQKTLNKQKKNKSETIKSIISEYSDNLIKTDYKDLGNDFGDTTTYEVLIESLSYFASGSDNDTFDHDKNLNEKFKNISKESTAERAVYRRELFKKFHDTNNQLKKNIESIDNELEDSSGDTGFKKLIEQRRQLSFNLIYKDARILNNNRYSFLQLTTFFSIFAGVIFFFSSYYLFDFFNSSETLTYSILVSLIPSIIGCIFIINKGLRYNKYKKYLESKISLKISLLNDVISTHDRFIKNYISQIKIEYTLEIIKEIQKYCKIRVYKLNSFRTYLFNHYIYSITKYNAVKFENSVFEYSLITKKHFEKLFFDFSPLSYFEKEPNKKLNFLNLYLDKSKTDIIYEFSSNTFDFKFFDKNEIANDEVKALAKHKSEITYHNEFDKESSLYSSDNIEDINQGQIGNCYFMASIGAIAHTNPIYLRNMITLISKSDDDRESTEQSFLVRFFDTDSNERYVAVDNKFWFKDETVNNPIYAKYGYKDEINYEIWPMILEKAWAKVNDGYEQIVGDDKNAKFKKKQRKLDFGIALSGNFIDYKSINEFNNNIEIIDSVADNLKNDIPIVVYSKDNPEDNSVVGWHAYTVKSIDNDKINLYNPHGKNHLYNRTIDFLKENFDTILFFNLEETTELLIPPKEKVKYIDYINEIEEDLHLFFGDQLSKQIQNIPISDIINNVEFKKVMKRIDKSSIPLFNNANIENEYSIMFTDIESINTNIFKNNPNDTKPKISDDVYLLLTKFISWKVDV